MIESFSSIHYFHAWICQAYWVWEWLIYICESQRKQATSLRDFNRFVSWVVMWSWYFGDHFLKCSSWDCASECGAQALRKMIMEVSGGGRGWSNSINQRGGFLHRLCKANSKIYFEINEGSLVHLDTEPGRNWKELRWQITKTNYPSMYPFSVTFYVVQCFRGYTRKLKIYSGVT